MDLEQLLEALRRLGRVEEKDGEIRVHVGVEGLREAARLLAEAGFDHVATLTVVDEVKRGRFRLVYVAESYEEPRLLVHLVTEVDRREPRVPSLHDIWPSLLWQERENWEMFGIVFEGHPDLRHLLLPPDWPENVHPLRKDFVVREEPFMAPPELQKRLEELLRKESGESSTPNA